MNERYALEVWGDTPASPTTVRLRPMADDSDGWSGFARLGGERGSDLRDWLADRDFTADRGYLAIFLIPSATALEIRMRWF
ncbi:hypothetical protein IPV08_21795 [Methylobacterium sp. SD274]|uniref:hypothetical protein n=1 Tax=Methylobacterium sp. SD274 TaxID=2782009 RepID=UPI001A9712AB|nr:hypothetical protein [Methylobacterium sp. SD274]MBO1022600.1 hypothetical protein [Methylobacterium sp. SD274]